MPSYSLASYSYRLNKKHKKDFEIIDKVNGKDLLKIFEEILETKQKGIEHDKETKKVLKIGKLQIKDRTIYGTIETGVYGFTSILRDIQTMNKISHSRKVTEAEMLPFYFQLCFPKGSDKALFLFQKFNQFGVRKQFLDVVTPEIQRQLPDYTTKIAAHYPNDAVSQWLSGGNLKTIRLLSENVPSDISDAYKNTDEAKKYTSSEYKIKVKQGGNLTRFRNRFKEVLNGKREVRKFVEIENFEYERVKVEVETNGKTRTYDLDHLDRVRAYHAFPDSVKILKTGHPDFDSLHKFGNEVMNEILNE